MGAGSVSLRNSQCRFAKAARHPRTARRFRCCSSRFRFDGQTRPSPLTLGTFSVVQVAAVGAVVVPAVGTNDLIRVLHVVIAGSLRVANCHLSIAVHEPCLRGARVSTHLASIARARGCAPDLGCRALWLLGCCALGAAGLNLALQSVDNRSIRRVSGFSHDPHSGLAEVLAGSPLFRRLLGAGICSLFELVGLPL